MLSKEELKKETFSLNDKLEKSYAEFNNELTEYIKSFNNYVDFTFSFSEKQSKESITNYYKLSVQIAVFYERTSEATVKLSEDLISAYDSNYPELIEDIDLILKKQILFEESIPFFRTTFFFLQSAS